MELYKTTDLEIVDKNIDQIINSIENTKKELYPDSIIKPPIVATETQTKEKTLEDVKEIVNITLEFVSNKKRKIYGGYAQNKAVIHKNKDDAFYKDTDVPDIDVYSPRPIEDLVELCNILNEKGYTDVIGREAIHKETYKIFTNGYNAIDLSYVPKNVFDAIPFIEINKIRYVNPSFSMIDLYRMLSEPLFSSWRWKKAINRLYLLQKYYPFENIKNAKVNDAYKHKKDVSKATNIIIDFIKDNESVYIVGDFAYNQLVKESKCKDFSEIAVGIYQIVSTDYKTDVKKLLDKFKTSNVNVKTVEYYPFFNFTDYSVEIIFEKEIIAKVYRHLKKCCPIKKINITNNSIIQIGSFDFIFLMEMVLSFRQKVLRDNNKKKHHDTLISNMIKMRKYYFDSQHKNLLDDSLFQSFIGTCIGKSVDTYSEAKKKRKEKKNNYSSFFYKPVRELKHKWIFANTSGNQINYPKNFKIKADK